MMVDNLLFLPEDILLYIFRKLRYADIRNVMLTCKTLRDLVKNDYGLWRLCAQENNIIIFKETSDNRWYNELPMYHRCRICNNWNDGYYKSKSLVHHYSNYMPWINFYKSEVLFLSVGTELVCYRTDNRGIPNCTKSLWRMEVPKVPRNDVRTNDISRFVVKDNIIACGNRGLPPTLIAECEVVVDSQEVFLYHTHFTLLYMLQPVTRMRDGCVAVYRVNNIQKRPKLECHIKDCHDGGQLEVTAVELINCRDQVSIISGCNDSPDLLLCTLKAGNGNNKVMYTALQDCTGTKCLSLNKMSDKLAVGLNGNGMPMVLDVTNAQFLITAEATKNHRQALRDIQWHDENTVVFVTHSGFLQLLDIRSREVVYKARDPFQSTLYCVKTDGGNAIIVGSAEYSRCVLFDARQPAHHVQMYFTQRNTSPVYCLDFDSTKLISAVDRGVAMLNFNIDSSSQQRRDYSRHVFH